MDINQFNIYSIVSTSESVNKSDLEYILEEIDKFRQISSASDLMEYLKTNYSVKSNTNQFYIANNTPVRIYNDKSNLSLEITVKNKEFLYCYKKGNANG